MSNYPRCVADPSHPNFTGRVPRRMHYIQPTIKLDPPPTRKEMLSLVVGAIVLLVVFTAAPIVLFSEVLR